MFDFDDDNDFDLKDFIESYIRYGLFEDDKIKELLPQKQKKEAKVFGVY